jgi:hypothetical protein
MPETTGFVASQCPIPNTHQRLRQAHLLWHQTVESYQEPELFLTNLNSLIQELRNITFILQSEKARFRNFDEWYRPFQTNLKANRSSKWLHDARNLVVKQGALLGSSFAILRLLTFQDREIARVAIPEPLSSESVLQSDEVQHRLPQIRTMSAPDEDPVLAIEKSWSTSELDGREVLEVLAEVYGVLASIVLHAHLHLGQLRCTPLYEHCEHDVHRDFPLLYDRSGLLRCMMHQASQRSDFFRLSTLDRLYPTTIKKSLDIDPWQVLERYGFDEAERQPAFEQMDPLAFAERIVYTSKRMLRKDRTLARIVWLRDSQGTWRQITVIAANRAEKHLMMHRLADVVREGGCDAFMEVGEMWTAQAAGLLSQLNPNLENRSDRGEALVVQLATRDGLERSYSTPFTRGRNGGIKLGETEELEIFRTNDLAPVRRAWRGQRASQQGAATIPSVWQPDTLEAFPCGGDLPFGVCCKPYLDAMPSQADLDVRALLQHGEITKAETMARVRVARYAIWVRQHTALSLNADREFAKQIIPIDSHALEHEINLLEESAAAAGHAESMLFTCRRLQEILGVPALARRMTSFAARWLIRSGRIEEGLLELDALGEISRCADSLALSLAVQYGGLPGEQEVALLKKAIEVALDSDERSWTSRNLVHHHLRGGRLSEAQRMISSLISDTKTDRDLVRDLRILQWRLSPQDADLGQILAAMSETTDSDARLRYITWLMDTNHIPEALTIVKPLLESEDVLAMILATECYLRNSDVSSASEIHSRIGPAHLTTTRLSVGYAHVQGLLVLLGSRDDLEAKAIQDLEKFQENRCEVRQTIQPLLDTLRARAKSMK